MTNSDCGRGLKIETTTSGVANVKALATDACQWHDEIKLAIADAAEAAPFGPLVGTAITPANLFHLAPVVCLKFRGKKLKGREADRVTKVALANYVANSDPMV